MCSLQPSERVDGRITIQTNHGRQPRRPLGSSANVRIGIEINRTVKATTFLVVGVAALTACVRHPNPAAQAPGSDVVPPGCSPMHGGIPETPRNPPVWRRGASVGTSDSSSALVVVQVVRALDGSPVEQARVVFGGAGTVRAVSVETDANGYATARTATGSVPVVAYRIGFRRYSDTVIVRGAFADTLRLGLGSDRICFM